MAMSLETSAFDDLFGEQYVRYHVPPYQRHYVWSEREWHVLWKDIETVAAHPKVEHFMGVLLTCKITNNHEYKQEERTIIELVDGQQRLTTFQIIVCAIRDISEHYKFSDRIIDKASTERKLRLQVGDDQTLEAIVNGEIDSIEPDRRLIEAFRYFRTMILAYARDGKGINEEYLKRIDNAVRHSCKFAQIDLMQDAQPAKVFESLNSKGQKLTDWDLLRTNLFLRAESGQQRENLYEAYWKPFFDSTISFWRYDGDANDKLGGHDGSLEVGSESFFRHFLRLKLGRRYHDIGDTSPYAIYCDHLATDSENGLEGEFRDLATYGKAYRRLFGHDCSVRELLHELNGLDTNFSRSQVIPLLLFVLAGGDPKCSTNCEWTLDKYDQKTEELLVCTLNMLAGYSHDRVAEGVRHPLSDNNAQFGNIIDVKKEFVLRDMVNWLRRDWPKRKPKTADNLRKEGLDRIDRKDAIKALPQIYDEEYRTYDGINSPKSMTKITFGCEGVQSIAGEGERPYDFVYAVPSAGVKTVDLDPGGIEKILPRCKNTRKYFYRATRWLRVELLHGDLEGDLELLKKQQQDPTLIYLIGKHGYKMIGRMGSYDQDRRLFYLRCRGRDIVVPERSIRRIFPVYEGFFRSLDDNKQKQKRWVVARIGEKGSVSLDSECWSKVLADWREFGKPIGYERVWFWLRWKDREQTYAIVDKVFRVNQDKLSIHSKFSGVLTNWVLERDYGWLQADPLGAVYVHRQAFRDKQMAPEKLIGEELKLNFNIVELYRGSGTRRVQRQARNVQLMD